MARMIRDYTDSDKINALSYQAEVLFLRLMMKADDFGSYYADPKRLNSYLFPIRDTVRDSNISQWLTELELSGLIAVYTIAGKSYLRILNYGQRLRTKKSKFPDCPPEILAKCGEVQQSAADCSETPPEEEVELEEEHEEEELVVGEFDPPETPQAATTTVIFSKDPRHDKLYEFFYRTTMGQWPQDRISTEVAKFMVAYPDTPIGQCGRIVNTWVGNYRPPDENKTKINGYVSPTIDPRQNHF